MKITIEQVLRALFSGLVAALICGVGFFCAWIGGVKPFTPDAGLAALFTFLWAAVAAVAVFLK